MNILKNILVHSEMNNFILYKLILFLLFLGSCQNTYNKKDKNLINEIKLVVLSDTSEIDSSLINIYGNNTININKRLKVISNRYKWSIILPEDTNLVINDDNLSPTYCIDKKENKIYLNLFNEKLYKLDLITGKILFSKEFFFINNEQTNKPDFKIYNDNLIVSLLNEDFIIYDTNLEFKYELRNKLENDELIRLNLINGDSVNYPFNQSLLYKDSSIIFNYDYKLDKLKLDTANGNIIVSYIYKSLKNSSDSIIKLTPR